MQFHRAPIRGPRHFFIAGSGQALKSLGVNNLSGGGSLIVELPKTKEAGVSELQGPYGPIQVSERFLQLIWLHRRYLEDNLKTDAGEPVQVLDPGRWNHREGPDFLDARWRLGGSEFKGDAEIHFYPGDWYRHGHEADPNFNGVGLHVCLFPPEPGERPVQTRAGREPASLSLISYLEEDLERLAEEEGLLQLESRPRAAWKQAFLEMNPDEQTRRIVEGARRRWHHKVMTAAQRLEASGWEDAMHMTTLEVLGLTRNRAPMLTVAAQFPYPSLLERKHSVETLYIAGGDHWKTGGHRPANHPRRRLGQYLELARTRPEWPAFVFSWAEALCCGHGEIDQEIPGDSRQFRKDLRFSDYRKQLGEKLLNGKIGGNRIETWVSEALLPLYASQTGRDCFAFWFHWYPGDFPENLQHFFRSVSAQIPEIKVRSNGALQGLLDLVIEEEAGYVQTTFTDLPEGFVDRS